MAALGYYKQALAVTPKNVVVLCLAGQRAGDLEVSEEYTQRAMEPRPGSWIPPYNLASQQVTQAKNEDAVALLKKAVAAQGGENDIVQLLAEDADLNPLRGLATLAGAFQEVVAMAKKRVDGTAPVELLRHGEPDTERRTRCIYEEQGHVDCCAPNLRGHNGVCSNGLDTVGGFVRSEILRQHEHHVFDDQFGFRRGKRGRFHAIGRGKHRERRNGNGKT